MMVRIATESDAEQLFILNDEFNGACGISIDSIRDSIRHNQQEIIVVNEEDNILTGFICDQIKKSFCYDTYTVELTEVYVREGYRMRGIAGRMITFMETYCKSHYPIQRIELLTGEDNTIALSAYKKLGYERDGELHLSKAYR